MNFMEGPMNKGVSVTVFLFSVVLFIGAIMSTYWIHVSIITGTSFQKEILPSKSSKITQTGINCSSTCPKTHHLPLKLDAWSSTEACPEYFRWIHEDLKPWKSTGITRKMVEKAEKLAHIRVVIVGGRLYIKKYDKRVFQTRDVVTVWGILQLLKLYPGRLPDLDLVFECGDRPVIKKDDYGGSKGNNLPPLFHYCGDDSTLDIVFPDWSFWGWPELSIKPWEILRKDLEEGNKRVKWMVREPYAYWNGNTKIGPQRRDLVKCNVTHKKDWHARIYNLDWVRERQEGFKTTDLASKCTHRYKIYVEGAAWSVSEKYILACDSVTLLVKPRYYDFFTRSLVPTVHYWPINQQNKCKSIKFAVEWGNKHTIKAQEIGNRGSIFVQEELKMKYVYDYMFHLLHEYAKLLKYQPTIPRGGIEVCSESMICSDKGMKKRFKIHSMVNAATDTSPCTIPPPYEHKDLQDFLGRKENLTKQVEMWEAVEDIKAAIFR